MAPKRRRNFSSNPENDMMDAFSPFKVGKIFPTDTKKKRNVYNSYRPNPDLCLDYNLSETVVRLDAGDTKINIKNTTATYAPLPPGICKPKKKKIKYSHGGPPQWKFVDEIWREKQGAAQVTNKKNFEKFVIKRKVKHAQSGKSEHAKLQGMVGPEWFQELSPKQLRIIDDLQLCIQKDRRANTFINTKEAMGFLGIVLRPNQKHVQLALSYCCNSAVEFLLILYQLMRPKRVSYSINDRILLSGVVHLTMKQTLRELHVRIPSPPKIIETVKKKVSRPPKKHYDSPYLEEYTFKPDPPKFKGIYENKHAQYPESPYFSYLDALVNRPHKCSELRKCQGQAGQMKAKC